MISLCASSADSLPNSSGFIILIVALCLIILASLVAIFLLLREERTPDEELVKRHQRPRKATYVTPLEDAGSQPKSWLHRTYQRLPFTRTASTDRTLPFKSHQNQNEIRRESLATSRDALHIQSIDDLQLKAPQARHINLNTQTERSNALTPSVSNGPSIRRLSTPTSTCSVRFDTSGVRDTFPFERDRFAPSPSATLPNIHTQLSSPTSSIPSSPSTAPRRSRIISQEIPPLTLSPVTRREQDIAQYSMLSSSPSPAPTTFGGGTKFIETF